MSITFGISDLRHWVHEPKPFAMCGLLHLTATEAWLQDDDELDAVALLVDSATCVTLRDEHPAGYFGLVSLEGRIRMGPTGVEVYEVSFVQLDVDFERPHEWGAMLLIRPSNTMEYRYAAIRAEAQQQQSQLGAR